MDREQRLQEYKDGYWRLQAVLANLPPAMWYDKPAADEWSVHEILIHLADSEVHAYICCRTILAEPGTPLMHFDEHEWSVALQYATQDVNEALTLVAIIRRVTGSLLDKMAAAVWRQRGIHSKRGPMTLDDWLETYNEHMAAHISQLETRYTLWRTAQKWRNWRYAWKNARNPLQGKAVRQLDRGQLVQSPFEAWRRWVSLDHNKPARFIRWSSTLS